MASRSLLLISISLASVVCSCAPLGSSSDLERRVDEQDIQLRQMQPQQQDTWNEVQAMRQEIALLKGEIANLKGPNQTNVPAPNPLANTESTAAETSSMQIASSSPHSYEPVTGITPSPGNASESTAYRSVPQPQSASNPGTPAPRAEPPSEDKWGQADPVAETPQTQPKKDLAEALFEAGVNAFNSRQYQEAQNSFTDLLKNYPKSTRAPQAQFYLAECKFNRNRFAEAALDYDTVINKYSKSPSAPEATLKQGIAFSKMGQSEAAKKRMQQVIAKYPNSAQATRAKAFLKTNK